MFWGTKKDNMDSQCSAHFVRNTNTIADAGVLCHLVWVPVPCVPLGFFDFCKSDME